MNNKQKKHKRNRNKNHKLVSIEADVERDSIHPPSDNEVNTIESSTKNSTNENKNKICEINSNINTIKVSISDIQPKEAVSSTDSLNKITEMKNILEKIGKSPETNELQKLVSELDFYIASIQEKQKEIDKRLNDEINGLKEEIVSLTNLLNSENPSISIDSILNPPLSYNSFEISQLLYPQDSDNNNNNYVNVDDNYSNKSGDNSSSTYSTYDSSSDDNESSEGYNSDELLNEIQKYMPNNINLREILPPKNIDELIEIENCYGFRLLQFDTIDVEIYSEDEDDDDINEDEGNGYDNSEKGMEKERKRKNKKNEELELCFLDRINIIYNKNLNQSHRPTPITSGRSRRYIHHYNSNNKSNENSNNDKKKKKNTLIYKINDKDSDDNNNKYETPRKEDNCFSNNNSYISPSYLSSSIVSDNTNENYSNENYTPKDQINNNNKIIPENYNLIDEVNGLEYSFNNSISIINERDITKELIEKNELAEYKDRELRLQAEKLGNRVYDSESDNMSTTSETSAGSYYVNGLLLSSASSPVPFFDDEVLLSSEKVKKQINEKMSEVNNTPYRVIKEELYPRQSKSTSRFRQPNFNREFEDEKCRINHFLTYNNDVVKYDYVYNQSIQTKLSNSYNKNDSDNESNSNDMIIYPVISVLNDFVEMKEEKSENALNCDFGYFEDDIEMIITPVELKMDYCNNVDYIYNFQEMYIHISEDYFHIMDSYFEYIQFGSVDLLFNVDAKEKEKEEVKEEIKAPVDNEKDKKIKLLERQNNAFKKAMSLNMKKSKYNRLIKDYHPVYSLEFQVYEHILSLSNIECFNYTSHYIEKDVEREEGGEEEQEVKEEGEKEEENIENE